MDIYSFVTTDGQEEEPIEPCSVTKDTQKADEVFQADYKIVAEIRPQDAYFLHKTRGATVVPTYAMRGNKDRVQGSPLSIKANTSVEFAQLLRSSLVTAAFPKGSHNRALEIVY